MSAQHRRSDLKAVLFDKDGTLLDFHATWRPLLRETTLDLTDGDEVEATRLLGLGGFDVASGRIAAGSVLAVGNTIDLVALWYPDANDARRRRIQDRIDARTRDRAARQSVPVHGLAETLEALAEAGYLLGIATNDTTSGAYAAMDALGLADRFCSIIGYDAVRRPKPAADMVQAFCRAASVSALEVVVVGDSCHDLDMARNAGAGAAIGVLNGTSGRDDLAPLADLMIDSIADLPNWLEASRRLPPR